MTNTPDKSEMKACDAQSPLSKDDPRIIAWDAYRATRDYKNTRNWALHDAHVDGSLWAAFIAGWSASSRPPADQVPHDDALIERVARALCVESGDDPDDLDNSRICKTDGTPLPLWAAYEGAAIAALQAVPASGEVEETERLRDILDTERYKVAIGVQAIARAIQGRRWLSEPGRGSYAWDDERYQQEFGAALDEIEAALKPLRAIAQNWSDCPRDPLRVAANRDAAKASGEE